MSFETTVNGKRFAFWAHPRCGSTTLHHYFNVPIIADNHHKRWEVEGEGVTQVCVLKHPCDILVSWFVLMPQWSNFKKFLKEAKHNQMVQAGRLFYLWRPGDIILLTERIEQDISQIIGKPLQINLRLNSTPYKGDWPTYYDQESLEIVENRFALDMKLWRTKIVPTLLKPDCVP